MKTKLDTYPVEKLREWLDSGRTRKKAHRVTIETISFPNPFSLYDVTFETRNGKRQYLVTDKRVNQIMNATDDVETVVSGGAIWLECWRKVARVSPAPSGAQA